MKPAHSGFYILSCDSNNGPHVNLVSAELRLLVHFSFSLLHCDNLKLLWNVVSFNDRGFPFLEIYVVTTRKTVNNSIAPHLQSL